jgi:spoIIIJ-associated protein
MIMQNQELTSDRIVDEGKTVDDAIAKGLERLGITREEADIEILDEGSKGVLNFIGAKQAKVIVRKKDETADTAPKIEELLSNLLTFMNVSSQISVEIEDDIHKVKIDTAGADGLLIGKKGQNLEALEHLLRRMVGKQLKRSVRMQIDVGGYRQRRVAALKSKAVSLASRVKASGKEMQVEPLSAAERRIIHLALVGDPQVRTFTIGDGELKNVVIAPQRKNSRGSEEAERKA